LMPVDRAPLGRGPDGRKETGAGGSLGAGFAVRS